ncbi:MAG: hypothetical protein FVQ85_14910 [Planctomycetes bacterium]|nr:hypothetical protein [Planctomycetota bacterium]
MKLDYLKNNHSKNNKDIVSVGLLGISAFMGVLILIKVTGFFAAPARAENSVKKAVELSKPDPNEMQKYFAKSRAIADELKKNNLFAPPTPKKHPVNNVLGILGSEALINGKWYKTGDNVGDAKIVAIEPTQVRIEWDGNEKTFIPFDAKGASPSGSRKPGGPAGKAGKQGSPQIVQVQQEGRPEGMGRFGGDMERMRAMRERFENMSPEERERARAEMRERFGGRGSRGGRRSGGRGSRGGGRSGGDEEAGGDEDAGGSLAIRN